MRMTAIAASSLLLLSSLALAAGPTTVPPSSHPHAGLRMLTPEERMVYREQQRNPGWRSLTPAQRCEQKKQMRRQLASMSPVAMQKLKAQLDARWNALPAARKQRIEQRIANHQMKRNSAEPRTQARTNPCKAGI
jgi:hypothetical protein